MRSLIAALVSTLPSLHRWLARVMVLSEVGRLSSEAYAEMVLAESPDEVIVATVALYLLKPIRSEPRALYQLPATARRRRFLQTSRIALRVMAWS